ncbi:MAG: protein-L-isoaspartate(D-aspartate) O-methyltransferase [Ancalomicrobiaceae bacterium]|nr:protein-L-isoaspartate(D-aspartate) O-methyltransferase [Ancalomicrobiaceae bacterium]
MVGGTGGDSDERPPDERERLGAFILHLRSRGILDPAVLSAIETTPRRLFVPAVAQGHALEDRPIGIECGQTISAPSIVALMLELAKISPDDRVLDVGTGSGYAAAVTAKLAAQVYSVDRYKTLVDIARDRFAALRLRNIVAECRDGFEGWPEQAPFDRILVSAAAPEIPAALIKQLRPGGILVAPIGPPGEVQELIRLVAGGPGEPPNVEKLADVRFVPLIRGRAGNL